jgi:integrase
MSASSSALAQKPAYVWRMPVVPDDFDRRPLTDEEWRALELGALRGFASHSKQASAARTILARIDRPIAEVYHLRHQERNLRPLLDVQLLLRREMHRRQKVFWDWSPTEWMETLCPSVTIFRERYRLQSTVRATILDSAYLLAGVTDLRPVGMGRSAFGSANAYFGACLVGQQCRRVQDVLVGKGYRDGPGSTSRLRWCLSLLFILNRSPFLEDLSPHLLIALNEDEQVGHRREACGRVTMALEDLHILSPRPKAPLVVADRFENSAMAHEWYEWCMAWYKSAVDLTPRLRHAYTCTILTIGRWLHARFPDVCTPERWTEDLALRFRSDLCAWTIGQYASDKARHILETKGLLGAPLSAKGLVTYLTVLRRYFTDLSMRPHAVGGAPARKIRLDFIPKEVFTAPIALQRAIDRTAPRDIDLRIWARLTMAAATLSAGDLPQGTRYPLSFYRALGLIWVTSARRPNEIARLRLECVRQDWEPTMLDEDSHPVAWQVVSDTARQDEHGRQSARVPRISYLHIPSGKTQGPFWIWIPDYVVDAINAWKQERPPQQHALLDWKDQEYVDYLFCLKESRVGSKFMNQSLIPTLCTKAGVDAEDAKGRITGHRGRSTRLTLLRQNGVSLDDLAAYAGHTNTQTIRRYVAYNPIQLHRVIKDADDLSRIIEGVVDMQAAAKGVPALRWFIGYDADGQPMYCGNQVYHTCPHRLDCAKCGMFIGGEHARLLQEGEQTLPISSKVPMTPVEKCVVDGDVEGAEACRATLQRIPTPQAPDLALIFHPEGLSNQELEQLAHLATVEALAVLRQALDAHEKRLAEIQQHKTGRNALIGAQKTRVSQIQQLIDDCEQCMGREQTS